MESPVAVVAAPAQTVPNLPPQPLATLLFQTWYFGFSARVSDLEDFTDASKAELFFTTFFLDVPPPFASFDRLSFASRALIYRLARVVWIRGTDVGTAGGGICFECRQLGVQNSAPSITKSQNSPHSL